MESYQPVVIHYDPPGAELAFYPDIFADQADRYFAAFSQLPFEQGYTSKGKERRMTRFFSELRDQTGQLKKYYYSGKMNTPLEFTPELREIKVILEKLLGQEFNSCLVNLYPDGKSVIGWHSDSEKSLVRGSMIASVSFGAARWFEVMAKETAQDPYYRQDIRVTPGSMVVMGRGMQTYYKHRLRPEAAVKDPRINLTFRLAI